MNLSKIRFVRLHVPRKQYKKARYLRKEARVGNRLKNMGIRAWM